MNDIGGDRVIGLDLGVTSAHSAVVLDARGQVVLRRQVVSTADSLAELEQAALRGALEQTRLTVVIEPTGPMWLPIAVYFGRQGHTVLRVSSAKAADLRRFLSRHAKSNSIDAETLARLPMVAPAGLHPVELGGAARASLDRRVRTVARLTREIGQRKVRIRALAQTLMPTIGHALGDGLNRTDLAVLERYAHPGALLAAGRARLARLVHTESRGKLGDDKVQALRTAAEQALQLWGDDPAIALSDLAEEITTEIRLLRLAETERARHEAARDAAQADVDPQGLATSLPGLGPVGATQLLAAMGRPGRFRNAAAFKSFTGLAPKASETGNIDRKSQPMSKAGNSALRSQLIQSANTARQLDPQLAAIYYAQMTQRGAPHLKALCVVAARLAERAWLTLSKAELYVIRDLQGRPISPQQARELIAEQFTVPADVRRRRRSNKLAGRAPQQCSRHAKSRHAAGHEAALPPNTITPPNPAVNPTQHTALTPTPA
ncbi:MAG TPA: transposase [Pseudonocardiaceae bacterium]|nr:transposase [Pseudonocardiaceae bacterium]